MVAQQYRRILIKQYEATHPTLGIINPQMLARWLSTRECKPQWDLEL
jgi:hypothetical protein